MIYYVSYLYLSNNFFKFFSAYEINIDVLFFIFQYCLFLNNDIDSLIIIKINQDSEQPGTRIHEQWKMDSNLTKRSKSKLVEKIMELGLCSDRSRLGKVRKKTRR